MQQQPLMITRFRLHNEMEMEQWDHFIESHPDGTPFHLSCWLRTINETYSFEPFLYVLKNDNSNISSVFPVFRLKSIITGKRLVSLPFSDYCTPLFNTEESQMDVIKHILNNIGRKIKYIEVRGLLSEKTGFVCHNYYKHHFLKLCSDPIEIKRNINKRTIQYSIKKAQKAGIKIREVNSIRGIEEFYKLNLMTRIKHGVPSQPRKFFMNMFHNMISKGHASILLAIWDSKAIAAGIFIKFKKTIYYKYNVSNPLYMSKKAPNHLLTWKAIEKACLEGYRYFDFGRTAPDNAGLMRYKEMWGAETRNLPYFYYPRVKGVAKKGESGLFYHIAKGFWQSMPDAIVLKVGPLIYRHLG